MEESQKRINEALNVYRIIKNRDLWEKLTQEHIDRTVVICLMKKDEEEFDREWSKIKADKLILLGSPLDMDWGKTTSMSLTWTRALLLRRILVVLRRKRNS